MIRFIPVENLLYIRNIVLREGKLALEECRFPGDDFTASFHLGYYKADELLSVATFHLQQLDGYEGRGYQLRGMATMEVSRGQGLGKALLNFGLEYLKEQKADYVWCNARKTALKFYLDNGFEIISDEFELKNIGPHYRLHFKIQ